MSLEFLFMPTLESVHLKHNYFFKQEFIGENIFGSNPQEGERLSPLLTKKSQKN